MCQNFLLGRRSNILIDLALFNLQNTFFVWISAEMAAQWFIPNNNTSYIPCRQIILSEEKWNSFFINHVKERNRSGNGAFPPKELTVYLSVKRKYKCFVSGPRHNARLKSSYVFCETLLLSIFWLSFRQSRFMKTACLHSVQEQINFRALTVMVLRSQLIIRRILFASFLALPILLWINRLERLYKERRIPLTQLSFNFLCTFIK